ncbi:HAD family hydrolase [Rhodobacter ferrooxidans]|uniref:phosphoglycolate phosphatase n=1 Tax=Rhodobacter ferrooxidans TaxID=371731 RepID=C8S057_9RHOB|nr:HAD family hydrolase [Rhodobacter sp. SW2]EEW25666.1 HAD-superfamily hydrolase, subfamily IA, variant 1 [Rhodobacter sp. SW2]
MIDGVIFDKDGTLFDFRLSWADWSARLLAELARNEAHSAQMAEAIGYDPQARDFAPHSPVIGATAHEIAARLLPFLPGRDHQALTDRMNDLAVSAPMAEAVPLLAVLGDLRARGLALGLATNDAEAAARQHLANHGVAGLFDYVAGYDSGHGGKPGPGMLLAFARQMQLDPARVVMVGDSRHDMEAGRAAGMRCVAVLTGIAGAAELAPHADAVLPDIAALGGWIDGLGAR